MPKTLEFDENDLINDVLERYNGLTKKAGLEESDCTAGKEIIKSFHSNLQQSASLGNQIRLEKLVGNKQSGVNILALSSQQRKGFKKFLARLFRG